MPTSGLTTLLLTSFIFQQVVEGKDRALSSSSSSSSSSSEEEKPKEDLNASIKLDESYLQQSQIDIDHDIDDSPLTRLESVDVGSPLQAQATIDDAELLASAPGLCIFTWQLMVLFQIP